MIACETKGVDFEFGGAGREEDDITAPQGLNITNLRMHKLRKVLESLANNSQSFLRKVQSVSGFTGSST